jgi:hypothetical protein
MISRGIAEERPLPTDIASMTAASDLVVIGRANAGPTASAVTAPDGRPQPFAGMPRTQTKVTVIEALRGAPPHELVVTQAGDRCTIGTPPLLTPGSTYVLFLYEAQPGVLYPYNRSAVLEVEGDSASTDDPTAPKQTATLDELRSG